VSGETDGPIVPGDAVGDPVVGDEVVGAPAMKKATTAIRSATTITSSPSL